MIRRHPLRFQNSRQQRKVAPNFTALDLAIGTLAAIGLGNFASKSSIALSSTFLGAIQNNQTDEFSRRDSGRAVQGIPNNDRALSRVIFCTVAAGKHSICAAIAACELGQVLAGWG